MTAKRVLPVQNENQTILIISDDVDMTRIWKSLFEQRNCSVISETNAKEGVLTVVDPQNWTVLKGL